MTLPLVTAVIPCHNHAHWVCDAIDSVANQDYTKKRIVVVDDGSTDSSAMAIIHRITRYNRLDERSVSGLWKDKCEVLFIQLDKANGPSYARNVGMHSAWDETDLFAFLDSDDLYEQGKITKSVQRFLDAPGHVGAVYSDYDTLSASGLRIRQYKEPFSREGLLRECIVNCDSLVSKKAIQECGGFSPSLRVCEDLDLWLRISEKYMISHIAESLVTIRVGEHSSTSQVPSETWKRCYNRCFEKARERANGETT